MCQSGIDQELYTECLRRTQMLHWNSIGRVGVGSMLVVLFLWSHWYYSIFLFLNVHAWSALGYWECDREGNRMWKWSLNLLCGRRTARRCIERAQNFWTSSCVPLARNRKDPHSPKALRFESVDSCGVALLVTDRILCAFWWLVHKNQANTHSSVKLKKDAGSFSVVGILSTLERVEGWYLTF